MRLLLGLALMVTLVAFSLILGLIYFWLVPQPLPISSQSHNHPRFLVSPTTTPGF